MVLLAAVFGLFGQSILFKLSNPTLFIKHFINKLYKKASNVFHNPFANLILFTGVLILFPD